MRTQPAPKESTQLEEPCTATRYTHLTIFTKQPCCDEPPETASATRGQVQSANSSPTLGDWLPIRTYPSTPPLLSKWFTCGWERHRGANTTERTVAGIPRLRNDGHYRFQARPAHVRRASSKGESSSSAIARGPTVSA